MENHETKPTTTRFSVATRFAPFVAAGLVVVSAPMTAFADRFDDQIKDIQNQVSSYQQQAADLKARAPIR